MRATPAFLAAVLSWSKNSLSRLMTADPPGSTPAKISALASAMAASEAK
jgi:hypothetical protein